MLSHFHCRPPRRDGHEGQRQDGRPPHRRKGERDRGSQREREQINTISELLGNQKVQEISTVTEWLLNQKQNITETLTLKVVIMVVTWNKEPSQERCKEIKRDYRERRSLGNTAGGKDILHQNMAILLLIEATLPHQNGDILLPSGVTEDPHQPTEATPPQRRVEGDHGGAEGTMEGEDRHPLVTDKREVEVKIVIVVERKDLLERESLLTLMTLAVRRQAVEVAVEGELRLLQETVALTAVDHLEAEALPFCPIHPLLLFTLQQTLY